MIKNHQFLFLLLAFYLSGNLKAQNESKGDLYNQFDAVIGVENTSLYNGIAYNEFHEIDSDQNKFLFSNGMRSGEIVYDGETYYNILMNYNIYDDVVLVKLNTNLVNHTFQLISEKIERFKITNSKFVRIEGNSEENIDSGIYEVLITDRNTEITLLKKHKLKEKVNLDKGKVSVYTYKKKDSEFILKKSGELYLLKDRKDFREIFPKRKNHISRFYRDYRSLRRSDSDKFMTNLIGFLITKN